MASDNSLEDQETAALASEVKALRALLQEVQAELKPAVQSTLRERSSELQRAGADLAERQAEIERLEAALAAARDEAARWRETARRGLDEIAERAREAAARFETETAELNQALTVLKAELEAGRAEKRVLMQARDTARQEVERRQDRIRSLEAKVVGREQRLNEMTTSLSWKVTRPLRWLQGRLLAGARLRRRLMKR